MIISTKSLTNFPVFFPCKQYGDSVFRLIAKGKRNGIFPEFKGVFHGSTGTQGIVESHGKLDGGFIFNGTFHPDNITTLPYRIDQLLQHPEKLETMRKNAKALGRPSAARDIVNNAVEHIDEGTIHIPRAK